MGSPLGLYWPTASFTSTTTARIDNTVPSLSLYWLQASVDFTIFLGSTFPVGSYPMKRDAPAGGKFGNGTGSGARPALATGFFFLFATNCPLFTGLYGLFRPPATPEHEESFQLCLPHAYPYEKGRPLGRPNLLKTLAGATGLEPATSAVTGQRSNQLSYAPAGVGSSYRRPHPKSRRTRFPTS